MAEGNIIVTLDITPFVETLEKFIHEVPYRTKGAFLNPICRELLFYQMEEEWEWKVLIKKLRENLFILQELVWNLE